MSSNVTVKAVGLVVQPNQLELPPGSLTEASNIIIKRDNVIESRRGYKLYGDAMGTSSDRAKQLMTYKQRILRHFSNQLEFDTGTQDSSGTEIFNAFSGNYLEPETGRRIRFIEANGNFYFTTDQGIKKISAKTASDFTTASGFITQAGGIKALDATATLNVTLGSQTGFLPQDSAVAYRVVWGNTDANNNLILGSPSQRVVVYNPLLNLELQDFNNLLSQLDNVSFGSPTSLINDGNYVSTLALDIDASASDLRTNLIALAAKIDNDILYADTAGSTPIQIGAVGSTASVTSNVASIVQDTATTGDWTDYLVAGSKIFLTGFTGGASVLNGAQTVATVNSTTITFNITTPDFSQSPITTGQIFSYDFQAITQPTAPSTPATDAQLVGIQSYMGSIITQLQNEPDAGTTPIISSASQTVYISPIQLTTTATVILTITIPQDVTTSDFYQIYRSDIAQATGVQVISDIVPNDELKLVFEGFPTSTDISNGFVTVEDITPQEFAGAFLYTNSTTGEGILQANDVPPFALDINRFKNVVFYANTRTRQRKEIDLLGVQDMITDYGSGLNTHTFTGADIDISTNIITINNHGYSDGQSVDFFNSTPSNLPGGIVQGITYYILNSTTNTFQISATKNGTAVDLTSIGTGTHNVSNQLPQIVISDGTNTSIYKFVTGVQEVTTVKAVADVAGSLAGTYWTLNSANDFKQYYIWYRVSGSGSDPLVSGRTGIQVNIDTGDSATDVAQKTLNTLASFNAYFSISIVTDTLTITNVTEGITTDATNGTSGFTVTITQQGDGEDTANQQVLLSAVTSPAIAVDETARSLVHVINSNPNESVYAYYLSGPTDVPGKILLEGRSLTNSPFYVLANNADTGESWNPDLSPTNTISTISVANPTVITTSSAHGLINGQEIMIGGSNSTPSVDGLYTITYISSTSFSIPVNVTVEGTTGSIIPISSAVTSDNESLPNRIYYSKVLQPEAVPIVNFMDVGAKDKEILRIFPLRDSLFVYKEDGLFRISGESAPFNLALFDSSAILLAPDSLDVSNNLIYGWSTQGIISTSEAGVSIISRPIDIEILKLATAQYTNFTTATWGIGYESDNSYTTYTVVNTDDTVAKIGYRYSTLTNTWTTFDKTATCGVINSVNDTQYLGAGDTNFIEQERKNFNRTDYADREFTRQLDSGNYFSNQLKLDDVSNIVIGDVVTQDQYMTVFNYNSLLEKLDLDTFLSPHDYLSTLEMSAGDVPRDKLDALLNKIANDPGRQSQAGFTPAADYTALETINGTFNITNIAAGDPVVITSASHGLQTGRIITIAGSNSTPTIDSTYEVTVLNANTFSIPATVTVPGTTGTYTVENDNFLDIEASFNNMIILLNADAGLAMSNYVSITSTTLQEAVVTDVNQGTKTITLDLALDFITGPLTFYKTITSSVQWGPETFGDPLNLKHVREATVMFENRAFREATLSFSSDLLPKFDDIDFVGSTNGIFGFKDFGYGFFGGMGNSAPFRTYIPRNSQRCRYLNMRFTHKGAREIYSIFGITFTFETSSTRAYR